MKNKTNKMAIRKQKVKEIIHLGRNDLIAWIFFFFTDLVYLVFLNS